MSKVVSIREFSRDIGCSDTAVRKAIAAGKISKGLVKMGKYADGRPRLKINMEVARAEWASYHNPNYQRLNRSGQVNGHIDESAIAPPAPVAPPAHDEDEGAVSRGQSTAEIKRLQAKLNLQADAIKLKRLKGELVEKKAVYSALYAMGQEVKNTILALPDRFIDEILAAPSRNEAHSVLTRALIEALQGLAELQNRDITV